MTPVEEFILKLIGEEYDRAKKFPIFHSAHEGYGVILEEVDELWDAIKNNKHSTDLERTKEAIQVAAMAMKYVASLTKSETLDFLCLE